MGNIQDKCNKTKTETYNLYSEAELSMFQSTQYAIIEEAIYLWEIQIANFMGYIKTSENQFLLDINEYQIREFYRKNPNAPKKPRHPLLPPIDECDGVFYVSNDTGENQLENQLNETPPSNEDKVFQSIQKLPSTCSDNDIASLLSMYELAIVLQTENTRLERNKLKTV